MIFSEEKKEDIRKGFFRRNRANSRWVPLTPKQIKLKKKKETVLKNRLKRWEEVVKLRYENRMTMQKIAEIMSVSRQRVQKMLSDSSKTNK